MLQYAGLQEVTRLRQALLEHADAVTMTSLNRIVRAKKAEMRVWVAGMLSAAAPSGSPHVPTEGALYVHDEKSEYFFYEQFYQERRKMRLAPTTDEAVAVACRSTVMEWVEDVGYIPAGLPSFSDLHTLYVTSRTLSRPPRSLEIPADFHNRSIKVLDLRYCSFRVCPVEVGNLRGLKVLGLSYCTHLTEIPPEIFNKLPRLQCLSVVGSNNLRNLPRTFYEHMGIDPIINGMHARYLANGTLPRASDFDDDYGELNGPLVGAENLRLSEEVPKFERFPCLLLLQTLRLLIDAVRDSMHWETLLRNGEIPRSVEQQLAELRALGL